MTDDIISQLSGTLSKEIINVCEKINLTGPRLKTFLLRQMLKSDELEFIMEAHDGLSAKIAEEAGFKGIWGSGLSISASLGVRDNNEASWTQVLDVLEFMSDSTSVPILLDGDTGYGNFNNFRRLVGKLEQRGIAGVCIEDKLFPKTNSFISGEKQPLADIDEFSGKIKAGKETQSDKNFNIIARVEAFIAGWGLKEAIKRAEAYRQAGADAILIHSKKADPSDIEAFIKEWAGRHPVVVVPTKYYSTPTEEFRKLGISMVIWANHSLRASISAMQDVTKQIKEHESLVPIEDKIVTVSEVFRLQGEEELRILEEKYLPKSGKQVKAIILAAARGGTELEKLTTDVPKAMMDIGGQPILYRLIDTANEAGIKTITVVTGYKKETIKGLNFSTVENTKYDETKDLYSLFLAREKINGDMVIAYGDTLFRKHLLLDTLNSQGDIVIVVDADLQKNNTTRDYVICDKPYTNDFFNKEVHLNSIYSDNAHDGTHGEWTGILSLSTKGSEITRQTIDKMSVDPKFKDFTMVDLITELNKISPVEVIYTKGGWIDIDDASDIIQANKLFI